MASAERSLRSQAVSLPNLITYLRILAIPAVLAVMQHDSRWNAFLAAILFGLASATDALDGYLARRMNLTSVIGKLLDPLADKLIVTGTLVMLVDLGRVSAWLVVLILAREMLVTGLRSIAAGEGVVIAARDLGKQKTAFQMVGIWCLLVHYRYTVLGGEVSFHKVGLICLLLSVGFSLVSAFDYVRGFYREMVGRASTGA